MMKKTFQQFPFFITTLGLAILLVIVFFRFVGAAPDPSPGLAADGVLGQTIFFGSTANSGGVSAATMFAPESVYTDGTKLYVADYTNNRVLIWNSTSTANGAPADIVLGQPNAISISANRGTGVETNTLSGPVGVYSDGSKIYVADRENNRVLIWNTTSPATGANANIVLGQDTFTASSTNKGGSANAGTLRTPSGVYSDGSKIYVADSLNNRVLIWNTTTPSNGGSADIVLGQSAFENTTLNAGGRSASTLYNPKGVHSDGSKIYVADSSNNRVLIWNTTSTISGSAADIVLGQDDFSSGSANKGGSVSSSTVSGPPGVFSDGQNVYVADSGNRRVLVWTSTSPISGSGAEVVLGRSLFTDTTVYDVSTSSLASPVSVAFRSQKVFVADDSANRVLRFEMTPTSTPSAPVFTSITTSTASILSVGSGFNANIATYALYDTVSSQYITSTGTFSGTSNWVTSSTWPTVSITGLTPGHGYAMKAKARYIAGVETSLSGATNVYTLANPAGTPAVGTPTTSTLPISWSVNSNSSMTSYAIFNTSTGYYLDATGAATSTAVYQTTSTWSSISAIGLSPNTLHQFTVVARNGNSVNAASSTLSDATYTLANVAGTPTTTVSSSSAITISFDTNSNPAVTTYAVLNTSTGYYVAADGSASASAVYQTSSSWNGIAATGLTANTAYQFVIIARNGSNANAATSTASSAVYTLSNTPSSVSASAGSTSIVLSWSGDGTQYYAENVTAGANSGWISGTQTTFSGLTCNTSYSLRVKAKNGAATETSFASVTATTASCSSGGGGGVIISPLILPSDAVVINQGQKETTNSVITLTLNVPDAKEMVIANTSDFAFSSFVPYKTSLNWTLSPGYGTKVVYVKFRSKNGAVSSMSQPITVLEKQKDAPVLPSESVPDQAAKVKNTDISGEKIVTTACKLQPGKPYKIRTASDVWYVTNQCTRRPIKNKDVYFTYFDSWKDVLIVSKDQLAAVPKDAIVSLPLGEKYVPAHGTFVQITDDPTIYYVLGNKKIALGSDHVFTDLAYKKEWIELVDKKILEKYNLLKTVTSTNAHLDLTLIKYPSSPKVYILEYGKKRHITSGSVLFHNRPFRFDRIITIPDTESYQDGEPLN